MWKILAEIVAVRFRIKEENEGDNSEKGKKRGDFELEEEIIQETEIEIEIKIVLEFEIDSYRFVHGRCLECKRCTSNTRHLVKAERMKGRGKTLYAGVRMSKVAAVEDFRPTSPGPSPGAGHGVRN
ncbi:hypothetical protein L1987_46898 [Smallanthus sonchifolius]|uniref:Uncharacterized protein n=1 Tax=Smallanthus sonchifolius TaxID=185202 RepID=A0ACB9G0Q8_9ASTR|nr:hypothetical protein L1987_46898 [Smallanthus sonchifolius]